MEKIISRVLILVVMEDGLVLRELLLWISAILVLILVVMEDGLVLAIRQVALGAAAVLILVVMEDGLVQFYVEPFKILEYGLNPCCNGRWSRTRPYKTILIISKLKNFTKQILTFLNRKLTIL